MEYKNLGNTGLSVSRICLGMMSYGTSQWRDWVLDYEESKPFVSLALDLGINFFDTADVYSNGVSEEVLGRAIRELGVDREDVVIASKCHGGTHNRKRNRCGLSRKYIMDACDASLKRLETDYIDLYQIHRYDYNTPLEETIVALDDLVRAGKVRYLGASSMFAWQMAKYLFTADAMGCTRFISMQNHYNLLYREEEREMIPLCEDQGVGLIPWSPMARGYLARDRASMRATIRSKSDEFAHKLYTKDSDFDIVDRNFELAEKRGDLPAQTAIAWLLQRPGVVSPIIGATKAQHLEKIVKATEIKLSESDIAQLEALYEPHPIAGHS